jgi:hypothetical protein
MPGIFVTPKASRRSPQEEFTLTVPVVVMIFACGRYMLNGLPTRILYDEFPFVKRKAQFAVAE